MVLQVPVVEGAGLANAVAEHAELAVGADDAPFVELVLVGEHVIEQAPGSAGERKSMTRTYRVARNRRGVGAGPRLPRDSVGSPRRGSSRRPDRVKHSCLRASARLKSASSIRSRSSAATSVASGRVPGASRCRVPSPRRFAASSRTRRAPALCSSMSGSAALAPRTTVGFQTTPGWYGPATTTPIGNGCASASVRSRRRSGDGRVSPRSASGRRGRVDHAIIVENRELVRAVGRTAQDGARRRAWTYRCNFVPE